MGNRWLHRGPHRVVQGLAALGCGLLVAGCETTRELTISQTGEDGKMVQCSSRDFTGTETDPEQIQGILNAAGSALGTLAGSAVKGGVGFAPLAPQGRAVQQAPDLATVCADSTQCTVMAAGQCYGVIKR